MQIILGGYQKIMEDKRQEIKQKRDDRTKKIQALKERLRELKKEPKQKN